jgi:hypothetical protein
MNDKMGRLCSTKGGGKRGMHIGYWWIILRLILKREDAVALTGLVWFRIETHGGLLFRKMLRSS